MRRQLFEYHPVIGYRFIPGLQTREQHEAGGYLLRTNRAGYRCLHEFSHAKRPDTFRILLFGDSYTAGDGVSDKDRYGDILEQLLPGVEVYNFGIPGSGTDQQYLSYREDAVGIEHDLVVIAVTVENIQRITMQHHHYSTLGGEELILAKPYFRLAENDQLSLEQVPVPKTPLKAKAEPAPDAYGRFVLLRRLINKYGRRVKDRLQRISRFQPLPAYSSSDGDAWRLMRGILQQWTDSLSKPAVILPVPLYHYIEKTASARSYQARFEELADASNIVVHDPLPDFHRYDPIKRRAFRFERDCHPTASAHRVLAESLANFVRSHPSFKRKALISS
jgi:lysophospholipase L1-like esterase